MSLSVMLSCAPAPSLTRAGFTDNATRVDVVSSSTIVTVSAVGVSVRPELVVPLTVIVSSLSLMSVHWISVKVAVPLVDSAGIVSVKLSTAVKSAPTAAVPPATDNVTTVGDMRGAPFSLPVTVTGRPEPPTPSETIPGDKFSVTAVDAVSSSGTITDTDAAVTPA